MNPFQDIAETPDPLVPPAGTGPRPALWPGHEAEAQASTAFLGPDATALRNEVLWNVFATMAEGVTVFDIDLRLIVANRRFREIFDLPAELCQPGTSFESLMRFNAARGDYGPGDPDEQVKLRVAQAARFEAHELTRERSDGTVLEIRGRPLAGGGFVTIYTDITQRARAERALRDSSAILQATFEHIDQGISIVTPDLIMVGMNRRYQELLDFPQALCQPGTPFSAFIRYNAERGDYGPGDVEDQVSTRMALAASFKPHLFERQRPDGTTLEIRGTPMPDGGFVTIYTDITQRAMAERAVRDSQERLSSLNKLSSDWFWEQDAALRFTRLEGRQFTGEGEASADNLGKTFEELGFEPEAGWDAHRALTRVKQSFTETVMRRVSAQGGAAYIRVSGEPLHDGDGRFLGYRGVGRDITPQKTSEARVHYLATHDALTGLPNRFQFGQLLHKAIQLAQRYQREFAVLFIDLDRFKIINDSLGHEAGDQLLCEVAIRLKQCVRASDVVARLGGDEFVMLIQEVTAKEQVEVVARNILATAFETVRVKNQDCRVSASIGICLFPQDAQNEASLMQCADVAMYLAKAEGKNNFQFYTQDIQRKSLERLTMEEDLRRALVQGEFFLHYQAKQDLVSTAVSGVEALIRWQHPERGLVSPMQFIPLAEETGLIVPIGRWVLREACQQHVAWRQAGLPPVRMAVNLSPRQFADDHLLRDIQQALGSSGMSPDMLELEITESMVMGNVERAGKLLKDIKHLGVRLAIDDFGTGYSSLAQIKRFPIDTIKVDRSFIRDLMTDSGDRAITEAVIAMGRALSLTVVAEGVETQDQLDFLGEHACHEIQGFHFSRPVSAQQCTVFMREHAARIASVGVKAVGPGTAHVLA